MKNLTPLILLFACFTSHAQTTGFSGTGDNIDVVYHRCNWRINPDSATKAIKGTVTTYFVTKKANVSVITFDLRKSAFNNANLSVRYHNNPITFSFPAGANSNTLTITLPTPLAINKLDSVSITYGGSPPAVNVAAQGYQVGTDATSGQKYVNTLSESYEDRDWWPCKADMQDKVDSMDIIVNVPWSGADTFWVATNGKLIDSTIAGGSRTFTYKTRYPIASYLVSVAVARYNRYYRNVVVGGTTVPIAFYLIRGKTSTTYTSILTGMDKMTQVLTAFNARYGDYPFKKEKHGYYEGLQGALGMEHQTFSAIASGSLTSLSTLIHELAHQWFGDNVSFATWNHLWLAEGFAKYSESLAAELVPALGLNPLTMRASVKSTALSTATTPVQLSNASIATSNTIWTTANDNAVYQRGAMVVSMLRALVGDAKFFQALKNYQADPLLANKSATTTDLKNHFEAVTGWDLDPFFNDWVLGTGNPNYTGANSINWGYNSSTKRFAVQVMGQSRSVGSTVGYFHTPIVLRLQGSASAQDTTITFYDQNGVLSYAGNGISGTVTGGIISFSVSFKPVTVTFDAFSQLLANGATVNLVALPVKIKDFTLTKGNANNTLNLSVYNDDNSLRSIVLQKSTDGIHFSDVNAMTKKGEESTLLHYTYTDLSPFDGATFYRAKIIEYDRESYTTILRADYNYEGSGVVSPNPATNQVTIRWKRGIHTQPSVVSITDISGRLIKQQQVSTSTITINVSSLAAGTYAVSVKEGDKISLLDKLVIVR